MGKDQMATVKKGQLDIAQDRMVAATLAAAAFDGSNCADNDQRMREVGRIYRSMLRRVGVIHRDEDTGA
jgi:hypothetical protein